MNIFGFQTMKKTGQKITMVTCYDHWSAQIITESNVDCILVGDSLAMVVYGESNTIPATVEMMAEHVRAVAKGCTNKFIIADLPFFSFRKDLTSNMNAVEKIVRAGAQAVKVEGADGNTEFIRHVVESGVPVMGHVGLTAQSIHNIGGFKAQGKDKAAAEKLKKDALALEAAGCFSIVLECIPPELAKEITDSLYIPTIGIGAGPNTSGQVLVLQDMLGMNNAFTPKYLKKFLNGFELIQGALNAYDKEVKTGDYPSINKHCYFEDKPVEK